MSRRDVFDSGHGNPEHFVQDRLPGMDDSTGRYTPEQEAELRYSILSSHGNKNSLIVNDLADHTNIPPRDLHALHNVPMRMMGVLDALSSGAGGYTATPVTEAQNWMTKNPNAEEGYLTGNLISKDEIEDLASPPIFINPMLHESVSNHKTAISTTAAHEIGHRLSDKGSMSIAEHNQFSADPYDNSENHMSDSRLPAMEGSAEGYMDRYAPLKGEEEISAYSPEFFKKDYKSEGPALFASARDWTARTGDSLSSSDFRNIENLKGVLADDYGSDLDPTEGPSSGHMFADRHRSVEGQRMALNEIDRRDPKVSAPRYEGERRIREMAINGQRVQGSLFPDIVPETNQYGDAPVEINRSKKGRVLNHMRNNTFSKFLRSDED